MVTRPLLSSSSTRGKWIDATGATALQDAEFHRHDIVDNLLLHNGVSILQDFCGLQQLFIELQGISIPPWHSIMLIAAEHSTFFIENLVLL